MTPTVPRGTHACVPPPDPGGQVLSADSWFSGRRDY